jgi:hypothetical protein
MGTITVMVVVGIDWGVGAEEGRMGFGSLLSRGGLEERGGG